VNFEIAIPALFYLLSCLSDWWRMVRGWSWYFWIDHFDNLYFLL